LLKGIMKCRANRAVRAAAAAAGAAGVPIGVPPAGVPPAGLPPGFFGNIPAAMEPGKSHAKPKRKSEGTAQSEGTAPKRPSPCAHPARVKSEGGGTGGESSGSGGPSSVEQPCIDLTGDSD
jgi:hypothetical protein